MAAPLLATALQPPKIDTMGAFAQGATAAEGIKANQSDLLDAQRRRSSEDLQQIASIGIGVMGGDINGKVDPQRYSEMISWAKTQGLDVSAITPEMIPHIVRSSLTTMQQIQAANSEEEIGLRRQELTAKLAQIAKGGDLGTTIYSGRDENGNLIPMQVGQSGFVPAQLPPGVTFDPGGIAGDKAGDVVDAKAAAAARTALPTAEQAYTITQATLAELATPGAQIGQAENFGNTFGIPNQMTFTTPQTPKAVFLNIVEQLSGQAFLQIRNALKGAGQVTDYEGMKGEAAISRMKLAAASGDSESFNQAVIEFQAAIDNGMRLLREQAQGAYTEGQPAVGGEQSGDVVDFTDYFKDQ